jgi:hypothetical protein
MNNMERAYTRAHHAVDVYMKLTKTDQEDAISDLICDLLHLAKAWRQDPEDTLDRGFYHFQCEDSGNEGDLP